VQNRGLQSLHAQRVVGQGRFPQTVDLLVFDKPAQNVRGQGKKLIPLAQNVEAKAELLTKAP
jgi:hypothetical protein